MKTILLTLITMGILLNACNTDNRHRVSRHLSEIEALEFKKDIIRYVAALPKKANDQTKFDSQFNSHYEKQLQMVQLDKYFPSDDGYIYFEISRIAPSFKVKRVATAGRLKYAADGEIEEYEEVYRTWKMEEKELAKKTNLLFSKLIANEDLSPYYTANSEEEYIEFPDQNVSYNKELRQWVGSELILQARPY